MARPIYTLYILLCILHHSSPLLFLLAHHNATASCHLSTSTTGVDPAGHPDGRTRSSSHNPISIH